MVLMIAPFPPPVSGQAVSSEAFYNVISKNVQAQRVNIIRGKSGHALLNNTIKVLRGARAAIEILTSPSRRAIYISVDANSGMYITFALVLFTSLRGCRLFLHHHSYSHVTRSHKAMRLISQFEPKNTHHIVICQRMGAELKKRYPEIGSVLSLSNIFTLEGIPLNNQVKKSKAIRLGYMSKISKEKGIYLAIETLVKLVQSGTDVELYVAGSFECIADKINLEIFIHEAGIKNRIHFLDFLSRDSKINFLQKLDFFLFPSTYTNETQGIVNLEALSANIPVIAINNCCISTDIDERSGLIVYDASSYAHLAHDFITQNINKSNLEPKVRFDELRRNAATQIDKICTLIANNENSVEKTQHHKKCDMP